MIRVRTFRLIQRIIILTTILCLFGSVFVWLCLYTEFDSERRHDTNGKVVVLSPEPSQMDRLDMGMPLPSLKRNVVEEDSQGSSIVVRNVFGIQPMVPVVSRRSEVLVNGGGKRDKGVIQIGADSRENDNSGRKYMFVFHHYEQFGKTTENFVQLCSIAAHGSRTVIEPFVRDSRMCGLQTGWWGDSLTKSRLFRPLSTYFDVKRMNEVLSQNGYSTVQPLGEFKQACNESAANLTLLHFLYKDGKESTKKWFNLTERQYGDIYMKSNLRGWADCPVIDKGLNISRRLGKMRTGRQLCVNPERVKDHRKLEDDILRGDKCVVLVFWKGFGIDRTHFKPKVKLNAREIVHRLQHSNLIIQEAELFKRIFLEKPYIAVHVRSERQLLWYSSDALLKCINLLIKTVAKVKEKHKINTVFLATDLTQYGSDTLVPRTPVSLEHFGKLLSDGLNPKRYSPHKKDRLLMDRGVVAIVEMNILSHSDHLITLGSGTFQEWVMALFIDKKKDSKQAWTISRVCSKEKKIH